MKTLHIDDFTDDSDNESESGDNAHSTSRTETEPTPDDTPDTSLSALRNLRHINPTKYDDTPDGTCLSFTVKSPWGHFRRIDGNSAALTYGVPPRTTIAGLISALLGFERNSYYDVFGETTSKIAIEPLHEERTHQLPENVVKTDGKGLMNINSRGKLTLQLSKPNAERQRKNLEVLIDPAYRVDVWVSTKPVYNALKHMLENGQSYYTPRLGLSEFLASINYHGEFNVEPAPNPEETFVKSVAPVDSTSVIPSPDTRTRTEKVPFHMTQLGDTGSGSRKTTQYKHVTYSPDATGVHVNNVTRHIVDDRPVTFL